MDGSAFDRLLRVIVTRGNRRVLLGLLRSLPLAGLVGQGRDVAATPRRTAHRHHAGHQHRHAKTQRRKDQRNETHSEACIPTGKRCPSRKPRGKKGKKLSCAQCCQGSVVTTAAGKTVCGCQPNGGSCTPTTASSCCSGVCVGTTCQAAPCSAAHPCPACQTCGADGLCAPMANGTACGTGHVCTQGDVCQDGVCMAGSALPDGTSCGSGTICCGGGCLSGTCCANADCASTPSTPICSTSRTCVACTSSLCPATTLCDASGACLACDVTCPSSPCGNLVQAAITNHPSQTVFRVCAGTYVGDLTIGRDLTLLGAGEGADDATNTILHGTGSAAVVRITGSFPARPDATLRDLRITGGGGPHHYGGGVFHDGNVLTMTDCTVTGNSAVLPGGGIFTTDSDAVLTRCTITANQATTGGGGIATGGKMTLTDCVVTGNTTEAGYQGGGGIYVYLGSLTLNTTRVGGPTPAEANHADGGGTPAGGGIYRGDNGTVNPTNASVVCGNVPDQCGNFNDAACQPTCPP